MFIVFLIRNQKDELRYYFSTEELSYYSLLTSQYSKKAVTLQKNN